MRKSQPGVVSAQTERKDEPLRPLRDRDRRMPSYVRSRHVAELIADDLREQILDGELADGDFLPRQEDLVENFRASRPSVREALRILETEGLISVRRGKFGGAMVHPPDDRTAAHTMGMVLRSRRVSVDDLSSALEHIEPICAALCASRPDRHEEVVPSLQVLNDKAREQLDDPRAFTTVSRSFHEQLVALCGNDTVILVVGALETVWSAHAEVWANTNQSLGHGMPELDERRRGLEEHELLVQLIAAGDVEAASRQAKRHLAWVPVYAVDERNRIDPGLLAGDPRRR